MCRTPGSLLEDTTLPQYLGISRNFHRCSTTSSLAEEMSPCRRSSRGGAPCGPVRESSEQPLTDLLPEQFPEKLFLVNHVPVGVYLSAGCPYRCSFCAEATMSNRQWSAIEPEQGAALIKRIEQQYRPNLILILDACFGVSRSWRRAFLAALAKAQLQTKVWTNNRVDQYDEEDIRLFSKVPVLLEFGLESCSSDMLAVMGKTKRPRDYLRRAKNVLTLASKYQLQHNINLIFNHPGETPETFHETIDFLKGVRKDQQGSQALMEAQSFKLFPGCDIWSRLDFYRKTYGTSIACKYWWRKLGDQRKLASEVKASKAIWEATQSYDYWHEPFEAIGGICYP